MDRPQHHHRRRERSLSIYRQRCALLSHALLPSAACSVRLVSQLKPPSHPYEGTPLIRRARQPQIHAGVELDVIREPIDQTSVEGAYPGDIALFSHQAEEFYVASESVPDDVALQRDAVAEFSVVAGLVEIPHGGEPRGQTEVIVAATVAVTAAIAVV